MNFNPCLSEFEFYLLSVPPQLTHRPVWKKRPLAIGTLHEYATHDIACYQKITLK